MYDINDWKKWLNRKHKKKRNKNLKNTKELTQSKILIKIVVHWLCRPF